MDKQLDVRNAALVQMLTTLPTEWRKVAHRTLSDAQQKALDRLIKGGLVDARIEAVGWMHNFPQVVRLRALVIGEYKPVLRYEVLSCCKAWMSSDGLTRDSYCFWYEVMEIRLTEEGELGRDDLVVNRDFCPVQFISLGGSESGRVRCEWFCVEDKRNPNEAQEFAMSEVTRLERLADGIVEKEIMNPVGDHSSYIEKTDTKLSTTESKKVATLGSLAKAILRGKGPAESAIDRVANQQILMTNEIIGAARLCDDALEQTEKNSHQNETTKPKWTWQRAKAEAEKRVKLSGYPGLNVLAKIIGCSASTLSKAIGNSTYLKARKAEYEQQSAGSKRHVSLSLSDDMIEDKAAVDPTQKAEIEEVFKELLNVAMEPNDRQKLLQMDDDQRAQLVAVHLDQQRDDKCSYRSQ
ncbi:MAG: hypothetical protein IH984_15035 [Planctomycetes bacterium]|nr:hypothetical protein [Planctomycetota bacterium]